MTLPPQNKVTMRFEAASILSITNRIRQQFGAPLDTALKVAHAELAEKVQDGMVQALVRGVERTGRPQGARGGTDAHEGGTLIAVLGDARNRAVTERGFAVGLQDFYEGSAAKRYYRAIDTGRKGGMQRGFWFEPGGPTWPDRELSRTQVRWPGSVSKHAPLRYARPFPGYQYHQAGADTFFAINLPDTYRRVLRQVAGISMSDNMVRNRYRLSL